jgi:hypothetical protein
MAYGTDKERLAQYEGTSLYPTDPNREMYVLRAGEVEFLVEYEFHPGSEPCYSLDTPEEGEPAELFITGALINGVWCKHPEDVLQEHIIERWEDELLQLHDRMSWGYRDEEAA